MDPQELTIMAKKFQSVFDAPTLDARGSTIDFCQRHRLITPFRFALSMVASMATQEVESIAGLQRQFNGLWGFNVCYKAFYDRLAKPGSGQFMCTTLADIMGKLTRKVLGFQPGEALSEFNRIILQDGSSFAIHDALSRVFPGRFNAVNPAAVELHCTMDLLCDAAVTIVLAPDTNCEHDFLPQPASLKDDLFLADRGYLNLTYLQEVDRHGGRFVVRAKEGLNPCVIDAYREDGKHLKSFQDRDFKTIVAKLPKKQRISLTVEWLIEGKPFRLRMIIMWDKKKKCFIYLLTNLDEERYDIEKVCLTYRLRWQIELLFKEWKSHANLKGFDTKNEHIAKALIWASLAAAALKRFLAYATEHLLQVAISTRKAAMNPPYVLAELLRAVRRGFGPGLRCAFEKVIRYLGDNAKRAHPKRDKQTGRSRLGLKPLFALTDNTELSHNSKVKKVA